MSIRQNIRILYLIMFNWLKIGDVISIWLFLKAISLKKNLKKRTVLNICFITSIY